MKKMLAVLAILLCLFISWNSAEADVIGFESLNPAGGSMIALYQEAGYSVTNDFDTFYGMPEDPPLTLPYAFGWWATSYTAGYAGSLSLFNNYQWLTTTLTKDDNTLFSMVSIELSRQGGSAPVAGGSVDFTGIKSDNSIVTQTFTYSDALAFQLFLFSSDFKDLKSMSWISTSLSQDPQFDNITMSDPTNPVPEPVSMLLFGTGIVGIGGYIRKRFKQN